jgi:hypothetical protein
VGALSCISALLIQHVVWHQLSIRHSGVVPYCPVLRTVVVMPMLKHGIIGCTSAHCNKLAGGITTCLLHA